jgi:hypothetical protein
MKQIIPVIVAVVLLTSCASSSKLMQQGRYDEAINKAIRVLAKKPGSNDDAKALDRSYKLANEIDQERIKFLKQEGNPDSWDEIFARYSSLKNRQNRVRPVLPLTIDGQPVDYRMVDYDQEIIDAKGKAAEYFYNDARQLMKQNTKQAYRQAYDELARAREYRSGQYQDIDELMAEARYHGINRVIVRVTNHTHLRLPEDFTEHLLEINTADLEDMWLEYHLKDIDPSIDYDYNILVNLEMISVSPENVSETDKMYKKQVKDGFDYVLDKNGNVMKDTLGNDIKIPKYKTLVCTVIESLQHKSVRIDGNVEILSNHPAKLIKKEPIGAENVFEHLSARAIGDLDALDDKQLKLLESKFLPFPTDGEMIYNCSENLKYAIRDALYRNRRYIY